MPYHKIIFEGAELAGKSFLMSQIYGQLEPKYNSGGKILDGCHWFNCDVGLFGTPYGQITLQKYLELMEALSDTNVVVEKFHFSEAVYQKLYHNRCVDFSQLEARLKKIGAKLVLVAFDEDETLLEKRLADRIRLYPHYAKIAQEPADYIKQQRLYQELLKKTELEYCEVNASQLPNQKLTQDILKFIGED
ncbi:MAG: hypothetical protein C3F02_01955 [Parcubacteria group bacterium]|nr:MAG: hypothetical protein C3F02_01955 [Parcubacteria group bacterium]